MECNGELEVVPPRAIFETGLQWSRNGAGPTAGEIADQVLKVIVEGLDGSAALSARTS